MQRFPVLTLASGLTNGMRGAAFLTGVQIGIAIDIGGTTINVGSIKDGFQKHLSGKVICFVFCMASIICNCHQTLIEFYCHQRPCQYYQSTDGCFSRTDIGTCLSHIYIQA